MAKPSAFWKRSSPSIKWSACPPGKSCWGVAIFTALLSRSRPASKNLFQASRGWYSKPHAVGFSPLIWGWLGAECGDHPEAIICDRAALADTANSHPFTGDQNDRSDRGFHCRAACRARVGPHHSGRTGQGLSGPDRRLQRPRDTNPSQRRGGSQSRCPERGASLRCPPRPWRDPGAARWHPLHRQGQLSGQGVDRRLRQPGLQGSGGPARCLYR
ncbi:hypothetical protein D3C80_995410 [compost metagenome]